MQLRDYQEKFVHSLSFSLVTHRKIVAQLATGGGKTVCFSAICDRYIKKSGKSVLILVHRKELLKQASTSILKANGIYAQSVIAGMKHIPPAPVYVAMIETAYKRLDQFKNIGMVIIDECFIAGTNVSGKNIEDINSGDYVDSYNHKTGLIEKRRVIATSKKETYSKLLSIKFSRGQFVCTQEHPIFVEGKGYIPAKDLQINDFTYVLNKLYSVQSYSDKRKLFRRGLESENLEKQKKWNYFLFESLRWLLLFKDAFRKNEVEKPNDESRNSFENERYFKKNWTQTNNSRGQWKGDDSTTKDAFRRTWGRLVSRISYYYWKWVSTLSLQNRFRFPSKENSNRSRWWQSSFFNCSKERQEKGRFTSKQRVQSIEIYQQGDFRGCNKSKESNTVYNLEVEGNNNYFANGILVHNCHLGNFTKVIDYFDSQFIIGFTATPLAAKKTNPLRNYFNSIVCGVDIPELIDKGFLCNEITYGAKETVDRAKLKMKLGEFDEKQMASEFSNPKYVEVTVNAYRKYSLNRKTIIFNCNVEHSILVCQAFLSAGFNCKHLDATSKDRERTLEWFDATPDAILCNVGIATTGFDQPDIETVIVNKATASMPLWLQMCGRGARTHYIKQAFTIIDLGGNCITHGQWSMKRDWNGIFHHPPKKGNGVAPLKSCKECDAMVHTRVMVCPYCETPFPERVIAEEEITEFVLMSDSIDVKRLIEKNEQYKVFYSFFLISKELAKQASQSIRNMNDETFKVIKEKNIELGRLWCKEQKKKWDNAWYGERIEETLTEELKKHYPSWKKS